MRKWLKGGPPPGTTPTRVLFLGPADFNRPNLLKKMADKHLSRLELIEVVTIGLGRKIEVGGDWVWTGVDYHALRWAESEWWTRITVHPPNSKKINPTCELIDLIEPDGYILHFCERGIQPDHFTIQILNTVSTKRGHKKTIFYSP